jgi:hypothetical protein
LILLLPFFQAAMRLSAKKQQADPQGEKALLIG